MKCKVCKEGTLTFLYAEDKVTEVWKCSKCGRLHKLDKRTGKCEPLVKEHKPELVYPDYEIVQTAKGIPSSAIQDEEDD